MEGALFEDKAMSNKYKFTPAWHLKLCADNIHDLRKSDVFRLLSECDKENRLEMSEYILTYRPEYEDEVIECMVDLGHDYEGDGK